MSGSGRCTCGREEVTGVRGVSHVSVIVAKEENGLRVAMNMRRETQMGSGRGGDKGSRHLGERGDDEAKRSDVTRRE
ncbi:hypothetical protein NDU88_004202 [Pleurodeles waltl]|uniref:Uncharacterized protein n=1 Tax=Pleurodeles waltl TaxID=8319 RepID=A0AAV7L0P2_PLEWA|nr:hypothetical protein NDU88_004202 [Pleurodeles waltl]